MWLKDYKLENYSKWNCKVREIVRYEFFVYEIVMVRI